MSQVYNSPTTEEGAEVPAINCECGHSVQITILPQPRTGRPDDPKDVVRGSLTCDVCKRVTPFEMDRQGVSAVSKPSQIATVNESAPEVVTAYFEEAKLCLFGGANRAVVLMARSCVEEALAAINIKERTLYDSILEARAQKKLGDVELAAAQAARLVGRNAAHRSLPVEQGQAVMAIGAAAQVVNHLFP